MSQTLAWWNAVILSNIEQSNLPQVVLWTDDPLRVAWLTLDTQQVLPASLSAGYDSYYPADKQSHVQLDG